MFGAFKNILKPRGTAERILFRLFSDTGNVSMS